EVTAPPTIVADSDFLAKVRITNQSDALWPARGLPSGKFALRISCQWVALTAQRVLVEYPNRFDFPYDLPANESESIAVLLTAPTGTGSYEIECDAVQEYVHWFHSVGSSTGKTPIQVRREAAASAVQGVLDLVDATKIEGWVWDQDHPKSSLRIEIREGNETLANAVANQFRKDLQDAGIGTGEYSFSIQN